jgi:hypothetical protein
MHENIKQLIAAIDSSFSIVLVKHNSSFKFSNMLGNLLGRAINGIPEYEGDPITACSRQISMADPRLIHSDPCYSFHFFRRSKT